jgi:CheY-like chemotaxis protein
LNSLLILSKLLSENSQGNLTEKQVEFSRTIHDAGSDLLGLINDILDLSKIESGTVTLEIADTAFASLSANMERTFSQIAQDKKLDFGVDLDPELPAALLTDEKRLQQIIKNLLSNAFKFTEKGHVRMRIFNATGGWSPSNLHLAQAERVLAFSVEDTGVGIPPEKQRIIFEAFQQADGTTSRKYGGTGLGLSISREITRMLGGELTVNSSLGHGSTFTLYLPLNFTSQHQSVPRAIPMAVRPAAAASARTEPTEERIHDDRDSIHRGDPVVLIVEDDPRFASILLAMARESGFKGIVTGQGAAALPLAKRFKPDAITLDIGLPDMNGLALLDLLKRNAETRHIPVHVISADEQNQVGVNLGAYSFSGKPIERDTLIAAFHRVKSLGERPKRLLIVAPGKTVIPDLVADAKLVVKTVKKDRNATREPIEDAFDCVVADFSGSDPGDEALRKVLPTRVPLILYAPDGTDGSQTAQELSADGRAKVVRSQRELLNELSLLLDTPREQDGIASATPQQQSGSYDPLLAGRKIVVIDDDIRNIFSLTSALEEHGVELHYAESGRAGIELLQRIPDADAALVDIMMPGMDGYETIQEIRSLKAFTDIPLVAVTAKAMKGDRQKCIDAGASDYVAKPVDLDQLISVLRVCILRKERDQQARLALDNVVAFPVAAS